MDARAVERSDEDRVVVDDFDIERVTCDELLVYPQLPELVDLINNAFVESWKTIPGLVGDDPKRYYNDKELIVDMAPIGVMRSPKSGLVATAGYKPWKPLWSSGASATTERQGSEGQEQRSGKIEAGSRYGIAAVAIHGALQKHGPATKLLTLLENEVASRTRRMGDGVFELLVRTGKENNER